MKKPIKLAAISVLVQIGLAIVLVILGAIYLFSLFSKAEAPFYLVVIFCLFIAAMGLFSVFFYNGFLELGKKFGQKMLTATSYFFMVWIIVATIAGIIGLIFVHPIIKNSFSGFSEIMSVQKNLAKLPGAENVISGNIDQMTEEQKKAALEQLENLDTSQLSEELMKFDEESINLKNLPEGAIPTEITGGGEISDINALEIVKNLIPKQTTGYIVAFFVVVLAMQIITLLFCIGIMKLADKVPYAKTTGILGIIATAGNILNFILGLLIFLTLANPMLLIGLSVVSNLIGGIAGIVGIIFLIFQIVLLFKASAELEK